MLNFQISQVFKMKNNCGLNAVALSLMLSLGLATNVSANDFCGCENHPNSLGVFDSRDPATWPEGTTVSGGAVGHRTITLSLPDDGVLIFDEFLLYDTQPGGYFTKINFKKNAANTPVTLLVAGDFSMNGYSSMSVSATAGSHGSVNINGRGGAPGNGGYRGGDGGFQAVLNIADGGPGLGATGGEAGLSEFSSDGGHGTYFGRPELRPLVGGTGGGGGSSFTTASNCSAGGGGGGGGAILIAVNGHVGLSGSNTYIYAEGGRGGNRAATCASSGGHGSGGAIRIIANSTSGSGRLYARGGLHHLVGNNGKIRIEAISDSLSLNNGRVIPPPIRTKAIAPLRNPIASTVAITQVDGEFVPTPPTGSIGGIDLVLPAPGLITFKIETNGVPGGTTVDVAVKPQVGGAAINQTSTIETAGCDLAGHCETFASFEMQSGAYFIEATATFRTP